MSLLDALLLDPAPFEVWIAWRTDGLKGSGTASDPYNGSTQPLFDARMSELSANTRVHLGPTPPGYAFLTAGYADGVSGGWQTKPGMKIMGAGIDLTVLKLATATLTEAGHYFAIGHPLGSATRADAFEVSDLTIDCNLTQAGAATACGAVRVLGHHARISRVKAIHWGTTSGSKPCSILSVITAAPDDGVSEVVNAGIENCAVTTPGSENEGPVTALNVGGQEDITFTKEGHAKSPFIRHCFVDLGVTTPDPVNGKMRAISMGWCRGGVVEGNSVYNADIGGPFQDKRSIRDLIVRNNFFKNTGKGIVLDLGLLGSSLVSGSVNLSASAGVATISGAGGSGLNLESLTVGDRVKIEMTPSGAFDGVYAVIGIQSSSDSFTVATSLTTSSPLSVGAVKKVFSVSRAIVEGNVIEVPLNVMGTSAMSIGDNNGTTPYAEAPDYVHGDIFIRNNKIRYVDGATPTGANEVFIQVNGAKNLHVTNNILESANANPIRNQRCGHANYFNNRRPSGVLIEGVNQDTGGKYPELETDNEFALIMSLFNRKTG